MLWQGAGVWERLHELVLDELSEAGVLDWSRASTDAIDLRRLVIHSEP